MADERGIGKRILELRTAHGLTQEQLGSRLNVTAQAVGAIASTAERIWQFVC